MAFIEGKRDSDICEIGTLRNMENAKLTLHHGGNRLKIADGVGWASLNGNLTGGAEMTIDANCSLGHMQVHVVRNASLVLGSNCAFNGRINLFLHEPSRLTIGKGCLFGGDVLLTTSDMHSIIDADSGARINWALDIDIASNVWVGAHATILKGVKVGMGSVVGAYSVVTEDVPEYCVVAGNPARILRRNVRWKRELIAR